MKSTNAKQSSQSPPSPNDAPQEKHPKPKNQRDKAVVKTRLRLIRNSRKSEFRDGTGPLPSDPKR
jgi:hypothetical protein